MIQSIVALVIGKNSVCKTKLDLKISNGVCSSVLPDFPCQTSLVCRRNYTITNMMKKAYSPQIVTDIIQSCCGSCKNEIILKNLTRISQLTDSVMETSDFVFPVLGRSDSSKLYGYQYIPLIKTPDIYYMTHRRDNMTRDLVLSCLKMWPLLVMCLMMVLISGFICWLMETWGNVEEFPRSFVAGWCQGIWWSFISITSVGYGDVSPKSIPARLFSFIWIIIGITIFSLLTAMLTSEVYQANSSPPPSMKGARVGTVKSHIYEAIVISGEGGMIVDVDKDNIATSIHQLVQMLHEDAIDGFVIDKYELMLFYDHFKESDVYKRTVEYLRNHCIHTEISRPKHLMYGLMVKNIHDYNFLADFIRSNMDVISSCTNLFLSNYTTGRGIVGQRRSLFSTDGGMFWPSFTACGTVIIVIIVCGSLYEFRDKFACWCRDHLCDKMHNLDNRCDV